jgi:ATPase
MEIKRDDYIEKLKNRLHNGMIKVITGIRRSGKSYLIFELFKQYILDNHTDNEHIIMLEFDRLENKEYRKPEIALNYIKSCIKDNKMYYVLLDEIQMLEDFVEVLNSLLHVKNVDVYVTGSNSKFLSNDILTEFRGRGDEIHVYPLRFKDVIGIQDKDRYQAWADYLTYGGLPLVQFMQTEEQKINYLTRLFEETYIKDITERNKVEKVQELNDIINVLASSIGSLTNPTKILDTFKSSIKSDISLNTIRNYIDYLKNAFIISEVNRYDVKGRKYIGTPLKYYFEDVGLRNARLGFRQIEEAHLMENVIYNELKIRGFQVDVGMVVKQRITALKKRETYRLEVDFIANLGSKRYYIQSALSLQNEEKVKQEKASLLSIGDSFKKIILVKDVINVKRDEYGITTMSIFDFLLKDNSLEL